MKKILYTLFILFFHTLIAQECVWVMKSNTSGSIYFITHSNEESFLEQFYIQPNTDTYTYKRKKLKKKYSFTCDIASIKYKKKTYSQGIIPREEDDFTTYFDNFFSKSSSVNQYQICYNAYQVKLDKPIIVPLFKKFKPFRNHLNKPIADFKQLLK